MAHGNGAPSAKPSFCPRTAQRRVQSVRAPLPHPRQLHWEFLSPAPPRGFGQSHIDGMLTSAPASETPGRPHHKSPSHCRLSSYCPRPTTTARAETGTRCHASSVSCRTSPCTASQDKPGNSVKSRESNEQTRQPRTPKPANPAWHTVPAFAIFPIHTTRGSRNGEKAAAFNRSSPTRPDPAKARRQAGHGPSKQAAGGTTCVRPHACLVGSTRMGKHWILRPPPPLPEMQGRHDQKA